MRRFRRSSGSAGSGFDLGGGRDGRPDGGGRPGDHAEPEAEAVVTATVQLPDGLLVDVLA